MFYFMGADPVYVGGAFATDTDNGMKRNQYSSESLKSLASNGSMTGAQLTIGDATHGSDSTPAKLKKPSGLAAMYAPLVHAGYGQASPAGPTCTSTYSQNPNIPMKMKLRAKQDEAQKNVRITGSLPIFGLGSKGCFRRWESGKGNVLGSVNSLNGIRVAEPSANARGSATEEMMKL